jgi:tRNA pseudouridine13 synthase
MRTAHPVEVAVGMEYYVSDAESVGGRLRDSPADFRVREIEAFDQEPVDADPDAYPHLLVRVTLEAWDTNDFAAELSDRLGVSRERVSWAGTKDKYAVTTQLFSVAKVAPDDLRAVGITDAHLTLLGRTGRPIFFGDLAGNEFEVVVRGVDAPERTGAVTADLRAFAGSEQPETAGETAPGEPVTVGVPNYFGQQRFGSERPVTHEVGLAILREDWRAAVLAYVGNPHAREREETRAARAYVEETKDWAGALERLPYRLGYERSICHRLVESRDSHSAADESSANGPPDDEVDQAAFRDALEAVPANLQRLFVNAAQSYAFNRILSARLERGLPFHQPVAGDVVCFRDSDIGADLPVPDTDRTQRVTEDRLATVRRHCERDRAFVTAPLVGTDTTLADGEPGEIERAVLADLNLSPGEFDLPGEFGSTGTRRTVLVETELEFDRSDALTASFALPKGSYATVLLREYLQTDPADL